MKLVVVKGSHLNIEVPDELARTLARIAAAEHKSIEQLAIEKLTSLSGEPCPDPDAGSAAAVLRAMQEPPHLNSSEVDELDAAIAACRLPVRTSDPFPA